MPIVDLQDPVSYQLLQNNQDDDLELLKGVEWLLALRHGGPIKGDLAQKTLQTSKALRGIQSESARGPSANKVDLGVQGGVQDLNKKRKRATREEVAILRRAFSVNPLPPLEVRSKIAQQLNWTPRKVKIWFQNERAKLRKRTRDCETKDAAGRLVDSTDGENSDEGSKSPKVHYPSASSSTSIPASPSPSPVLGGGLGVVSAEKRMTSEGSSPSSVTSSISSQLSHPCVLSSVKINQSAYPFPFHSAMTPFRQWATSGGDQ